MISTEQVQNLLNNGGGVVGQGGEKIGKVSQVFLDDETAKPEWVTVKTGMFGGAESFIPLAHADLRGTEITVPYSKDTVKDAPRFDDSEGRLSQQEEAELYGYYGLDYSEADSDSGLPTGGRPGDRTGDERADRRFGESGAVGHDTSGPTTDDAMTRSEEQLHVGTEKRVAGKARLRKYVVTENVTQTVPVTREEVRLEREPITDANRDAAMTGGDITSEEHEVTLTEERPVVSKETTPVERVRMDTVAVTDEQQVNESLRKEQIETDIPEVDQKG
jgi:uncharacterized protein (TIGR02271 family)